ncbi:MAG TPA: isoprenylcysteine carboxylmethyltransferase family protein [Candidatus Paceibacterota bacterium]|nr:isoprenylcysteine carboxylmethyltransferase family protein [Candidatus Paceibacterota bacterium]
MINLILLFIAILGFLVYFTFMTIKFTRHIKITKRIAWLHIFASIIALISFIPLLIYNFNINLFSIFFVLIIFFSIILLYESSTKLKSQTIVPKNKLIIKGIYKYIRNPMYLGIILAAYSCFFISFSYYILSYAIITNALFLIIIKTEEKDLIKRFGKNYINYKSKVSSLIPIKHM